MISKALFLFRFSLNLLISLPFMLSGIQSFAQKSNGFSDDRQSQTAKEFRLLLSSMPPEVQFGIQTSPAGDVYFVMNDRHWLNKLFEDDALAVCADMVTKDIYSCKSPETDSARMVRGFLLKPVYRYDMMLNMQELVSGIFSVKIGHLPAALLHKELEGNLLIVKNTGVIYYMNFLNIDRSAYHLLPMGLYTDTLLNSTASWSDSENNPVTYSRKLSLSIPFERGKSNYSKGNYLSLVTALNLSQNSIRKIEIRAYSSVEGPEEINDTLMASRARAILKAIKNAQPDLNESQIKIMAAENWLEFYKAAAGSELAPLADNSKIAVKTYFSDKAHVSKYESLLASERKVLVTVYLQDKTASTRIAAKDILGAFRQAISSHQIQQAKSIEKEIALRIMDNRLPASYMGKLEIPMEKEYLSLLSNQVIYAAIFKSSTEYEALKQCMELQKLDPSNEKIAYNISALRLRIWEQGMPPADESELLSGIKTLARLGTGSSLVQRMLINYHILKSAAAMSRGDYKSKNASLDFIADSYLKSSLNDLETYSLAKYFAYYARFELAERLVAPRIDQIDADEDLIFYYLNLEFARPASFRTEKFRKAVLNAINLDRPRFCHFFSSPAVGGASFQLLERKELKAAYCATCN